MLYSAFAFAPNETYLSVNRISVETYDLDVRNFVMSHPAYQVAESSLSYRRALMNVSDINSIKIINEDEELAVNVEVEPRDTYTKSHAGIFVRTNGQNIVSGRKMPPETLPVGVSVDMVLQEVQWKLKDLSTLQVCNLPELNNAD